VNWQDFVAATLSSTRDVMPMVTLFVRHTVSNYETWRQVYDDFAPTRQAMGVTADAVYRGVANTNDVTVAHEFERLEIARAFLASEELGKAMKNAGVVGSPTIWFATRS
jgi:hypothetical protein